MATAFDRTFMELEKLVGVIPSTMAILLILWLVLEITQAWRKR